LRQIKTRFQDQLDIKVLEECTEFEESEVAIKYWIGIDVKKPVRI
jgi:hypothetical protein